MSDSQRALALVSAPSPEEQARRDAEAEALDARLRYIVEEMPDHPHLVTGSVAGASSSSFHVYRQSRRREQDRIAKMEEHLKAKQVIDAFEAKRKELASEDEERTAKKRAKRLKKRAKKGEKKREVGDGPGKERGEPADEKERDEAQAAGGGDRGRDDKSTKPPAPRLEPELDLD